MMSAVSNRCVSSGVRNFNWKLWPDFKRADALEFLRNDGGVYDIVFLDPPFADKPWVILFERLRARLSPDAMVYRESGEALLAPDGWEIYRAGRAGQVNYQLLKLLKL